MIPKIIHYCWIGGASLPELAEKCIASWHRFMSDWEYKRWDEATLTQALSPQMGQEGCWLDQMPLYVRQAYEARKFAFVSDYVRLWALEQYGGLYMDVDFEVYRPFDELMTQYPAFAGYEGSKRQPVMQGVIASEPHGAWVRDMLATYDTRAFIKDDGSLDLTPNTAYFTDRLISQGFVADGVEKDFYVATHQTSNITHHTSHITHQTFLLHVFPVHYFCPGFTTGENIRTPETYCEHKGESSWAVNNGWKAKLLKHVSPEFRTKLIKLKRSLLG